MKGLVEFEKEIVIVVADGLFLPTQIVLAVARTLSESGAPRCSST
jgi:hypothetical protein